uniref:Properdin n=1 Tax=Neogobius melanostomus TaxID=47308 RepID=A0A8C6UQM0_9GOBI
MDVFWCTLLLLLHFHTTDGVQCFSRFVPSSLTCEGVIGEVDQDTCCLNPKYGFMSENGGCHSCGPPTWTSWSDWSQCTTLCGEGVRLRRRSCYGISQSACATGDKLQAEACNGTCCDGEGWSPWSDWSACSVSCGEGVKHRKRKCSAQQECVLACPGDSEETQACPVLTCPDHGGWSVWADWSECSGTCIHHQGNVPTRVRRRSCSSPPPSVQPPGDGCPGDSVHTQQCTELPNCAVDGGWGPWSDPGPCSVSCGEGLQLSHRSCDQPPTQYGGRYCDGPSTRTSVCKSPCPVPSFWTGWSEWSECSGTCLPDEGRPPQRTRQRLCITPGGSGTCEGPTHESGPCPGLDYCKVHGSWGPWSAFSACPVTCGVGLQTSTRSCNSPAPKHGGQRCPGDTSRFQMCNTQHQCPVDGVWSEWSPWEPCQDVYEPDESINCENLGGTQSRQRYCLHRALGGAACPLEPLSETRVCYDVDGCYVKGQWAGWEPWSQCKPPCGAGSKRSRKAWCKPDFKDYSLTIGLREEPATFFGEPVVDCGPPATREKAKCVNVPPCE